MDERDLVAAVARERDRLNAVGYDLPIGASTKRCGPVAELKAWLADKLVYWAFCLDRERFRIR